MSTQTLGFVFPGQGSQQVGMLAAIADEHPVVNETFNEAADCLGYDMWAMVQTGDQATLNLTEHTQPILLTSSVALWRVWQQVGGSQPAMMAGHSLGEFSALVCADAMSFSDAVALVRDRGRFMQTAVPVGVGAMAAILGLDDQQIVQLCTEAAQGDIVEAVNFNSPGQVVIAGHAAAVERAIALCSEAGAKRAMPLPVSAPFHTSLMRPAGERLAESLQSIEIRAPKIPVVHNVHAATEHDPETIRNLLIEQIYSPVRWVDCVNTLVNGGIDTTLECGPGRVLSGLGRRIHKPLKVLNIEDPESLAKALAALAD